MPAKPKKTSKAKSGEKIPAKQWKMPSGFSADGKKMITLKELVDPRVGTMSLGQLTEDQLSELVAKRIQIQDKFELRMVGAGIVDKDRAMEEVKAKSDVGRVLIEIELRLINNLLKQSKKKR